MDRFDILDIIKVLDSVGSKKRFSSLSVDALMTVWKEITRYLEEQLLQNRSIIVPQLGTFYILKDKTTTNFIPFHAWEKIPGYRIEKITQQGSISSEILRFTAISVKCNISRDDIETGLKDIIYALTKVLKRGSTVILTIGNIGKLHFQNNNIKMRYSNSFLKLISAPKSDKEPEVVQKRDSVLNIEEAVQKTAAPLKTVEKEHVISETAQGKQPQDHAPILQDTAPILQDHAPILQDHAPILQDTAQGKDTAQWQNSDHKQVPLSTSKEVEIQEKQSKELNDIEQMVLEPDYPKESDSLQELRKLVENTLGMGQMHTHSYTGDRQWKDSKCPICRVKAQKAVFETKEQIFKKEKLNDKAIMTLALEIDKELLKKAQALERKRHETDIANSQFNYEHFLEAEQKRKAEVKNHPMGNLFEQRRRPIFEEKYKQQQELADYLHQQIEFKHEKAKKEKQERDLELIKTRELNSNELKQSEIDYNLKKLVRLRDQREALAEQIRARKELEATKPESPCENPHARSESLMVLYKKEKAKQLYLEQIELMKQKKEYEAKIAELDRKHSLERVITTRKGLEKDLKAIKIAKYQQRKSLEEYWKQQLAMK